VSVLSLHAPVGVAEDKRSSTGNYCVPVREEIPLSPGIQSIDKGQ